jgi:hypothetical protein
MIRGRPNFVIDGAMVWTAARWDNIRNLSILGDRAPIRKQRLSNIEQYLTWVPTATLRDLSK